MKRICLLVSLLVIAAGCASRPKHTAHQGGEMSSTQMSGRQTSTRQTSTVTTTSTVATGGLNLLNADATLLKQDMRKLWTDHVVWTRCYIIAALGDQPDATAAANR